MELLDQIKLESSDVYEANLRGNLVANAQYELEQRIEREQEAQRQLEFAQALVAQARMRLDVAQKIAAL